MSRIAQPRRSGIGNARQGHGNGNNSSKIIGKTTVQHSSTRSQFGSSRVPAPRRHRRFPTAFSSTLRRSPPAIPPSLLRFVSELDQDKNWPGSQPNKKKDNVGPGRVKVLLRVSPQNAPQHQHNRVAQGPQSQGQGSILRVEGNRKHVTIFDSESGLQSARRRVGVSAPKLYTFDAVFPQDASQAEICSTSLVDVIQSVVQGADGAVFCYGHSGLGKTYTLIGSDANEHELGIIPCAISWLYRAIDEMKDKTKGRFSVRISAIEVHGRTEQLKDLLKDYSKDDMPGEDLCVREDPLFGTQLQNQCELRASSVEKAAYYLDAALASRSSSKARSTEEARRHSHMVYTLHIYQYRLDKNDKTGVTGGRSRLHFIDLGSCERTLVKTPNSLTLSLNSLGHVIMAIINNSKHVPFKESKLTLVLQELLGNFNCRTVMLAHVGKDSTCYADTLSTVQMASRIHRVLLKKKTKGTSGSVKGIGCHVPKSIKSHRTKGTDEESIGTSSGVGETSGSEVSCDTVIYVRPNGVAYSDRELTDNEGPPASVPIVPICATPQPVKSLSKITENQRIPDNNHKQHQRTVDASSHCRTQKSPSKLPTYVRSSEARQTSTKTKLANHAKLVSNLQQQNRGSSRLPQPTSIAHNSSSRKRDTTATDKRPHSKIPNKEKQKDSTPNRIESGPRNGKRRGKVPPPPPPRLPTTRLSHSETTLACSQSHISDVQNPIYETLHAPHPRPETVTPLRGKAPQDAASGNFFNEGYLKDKFERSDETARLNPGTSCRNGLEGSSTLDDQVLYLSNRSKTAISNMSYSSVTIDQSPTVKSDLSRCLRNFSDALSSVEEQRSQFRPNSLEVNINDEEWDSPDDTDDTITTDNDVSDCDEDVIGVNFYCLSFTTKNPLIPLSKRSFVQQVSRNKRMSLERLSKDSSGSSDNPRDDIQTWASKVNHTYPQDKSEELKLEDYEGQDKPSESKLKRSGTFDVESELPISLLPDSSTDSNDPKGGLEQDNCDVITPDDSMVSISGASSVSSPSQVVLYDSSSLEINYVKPKSFCDRNALNKQASDNAANVRSANLDKAPDVKHSLTSSNENHMNGVNSTAPSFGSHVYGGLPPKTENGGMKVLVAGSGYGNGAQLSLVKSGDSSSTLQLVITAEDGDDRNSTHGNSEHSLSVSDAATRGSPAKRSKWSGWRRFATKRDKISNDRSRSRSPANGKMLKKAENLAVQQIKATSSPAQSFVSKLLSPKSKRCQKSIYDTAGNTEFRYRQPNAISSQIRPDMIGREPNGKDLDGKNQIKNSKSKNLHVSSAPYSGRTTTAQTPRSRFGFTKKSKF